MSGDTRDAALCKGRTGKACFRQREEAETPLKFERRCRGLAGSEWGKGRLGHAAAKARGGEAVTLVWAGV